MRARAWSVVMKRYWCGNSPGPFTVPVSASVLLSSFMCACRTCGRKSRPETGAVYHARGRGKRKTQSAAPRFGPVRVSVERGLLDDAAPNVGERVDDDEGGGVVLFDDALDAAYLKARDDAEEYVLLGVSPAATPLVDGHAAA